MCGGRTVPSLNLGVAGHRSNLEFKKKKSRGGSLSSIANTVEIPRGLGSKHSPMKGYRSFFFWCVNNLLFSPFFL